MIIQNPWVGYLNRSYSSIKASILTRLKISAPEISDYSESNILIVMISIFSGITEMLNYYIDSMAREGFLATAKKFTSIQKIVALINYRIKSAISSSVDLTFTCIGGDGNPLTVAIGETVTIPKDTSVTDSQGKAFLTTRAGYITEGLSSVRIPARQQQIISLGSIGTSSGAANISYNLPTTYDDSTLYCKVGDDTWDLVENFGFSSTTDKHFIVGVGEEGIPYLQFGDGVNGLIPTGGANIQISYRTTLGIRGNLPADSLKTLVSTITIPTQSPAISSISVTNINASSGGLDIEGLERIRKSAPLHLSTLNRAVTYQDYINVAKLAPSVDKAQIKFNCGKVVTLYISPVGGGIASSQVLADTKTFIENRGIAGLSVETKAAGETYIGLEVLATAKFRVNTNLVTIDIQNALVRAYSSENSDINKPVRTSDIISLIDNLEKVDFLDLVQIYAIPYARPNGHNIELEWERMPGAGCTKVNTWRILWNGTNFILYKGGSQVHTLTLNTSYTYSNLLTLKILSVPAGITNGASWDFKTYPINQDIILDDYTMPRVHPQLTYVDLTVNEQSF